MSEPTGTPVVARAIKWSAVTTVARFALQLGAQVTLARMLGPGNFGVYGIGIAILTFAAFLSGGSASTLVNAEIVVLDAAYARAPELGHPRRNLRGHPQGVTRASRCQGPSHMLRGGGRCLSISFGGQT